MQQNLAATAMEHNNNQVSVSSPIYRQDQGVCLFVFVSVEGDDNAVAFRKRSVSLM